MTANAASQTQATREEERHEPRVALLDHLRGMLIGCVIIFHFAVDLSWAGLITIDEGRDGWIGFCTFVSTGLICSFGFLVLAPASPLAGASIYLVTVWFCIRWSPRIFQVLGVHLLCLCVGWASAVTFDRCGVRQSGGAGLGGDDGGGPNGLGRFLHHSLRRLLRLAACAALVTVISELLAGARRRITFGALHMIAAVSVLHLPALWFPRLAAPAAAFLNLVAVTGRLPEPERLLTDPAVSLDYQPALANLAFVLWGVAAHHHGAARRCAVLPSPLAILFKKDIPPYDVSGTTGLGRVFVRVGQRTLLVYLCHQALLFPVAVLLRRACDRLS